MSQINPVDISPLTFTLYNKIYASYNLANDQPELGHLRV